MAVCCTHVCLYDDGLRVVSTGCMVCVCCVCVCACACVCVHRFRNLEFLENELEAYYQAEQEKLEAQERRLKKMQKRLA